MTQEIPAPSAGAAPQGEPAAQPELETPGTPPTGEQPSADQVDPPANPPPKKVDGRLKRINELTYQLRETQRQYDRLAGMMEHVIRQGHTQQPQAKQPPKLADYPDLGSYLEARDQFLVEFNGKRVQEPKAPQQPTEENNPRWDSQRESFLADGEEQYEGFAEAMQSDELVITQPMAGYMMFDADNGTELAWHLAQNPKEARRIARLSPGKQIAELTRMNDKLSQPKPQMKKPSSAPEPVNPLGGGKAEVGATPNGYQDFVKKRRAGVKLNDMLK